MTNIKRTDQRIEIENNGHRLVFKADCSGKERYVSNEVLTPDGDWIKVLDGCGNLLVSGALFNIAPSNFAVQKSPSGALRLEFKGTKTGKHDPDWKKTEYFDEIRNPRSSEDYLYHWKAEVSAHQNSSWFHIRFSANLLCDLHMSEPQPGVLWWSEFPLKDRVFIEQGPGAGWCKIHNKGNTFPAAYLWSAAKNAEVIFFFNMTPMQWMSRHNMRRFVDYEVAIKDFDAPGRGTGIGLFPISQSGNRLPFGSIIVDYWIYGKYKLDRPTHSTALDTLVSQCERIADSTYCERPPAWPEENLSWRKYSENSLMDLFESGKCTTEVNKMKTFTSYVAGVLPDPMRDPSIDSSGVDKLPQAIRPGDFNAIYNVYWPLMIYNKIHPSPKIQQNIDKHLEYLPRFYDKKADFIVNSLPNDEVKCSPLGEPVVNTWYNLHNCLKTAWLAMLSNNQKASELFLKSIDSWIDVGKKYNYILPIRFSRYSHKPNKEHALSYPYDRLYISPFSSGLLAYNLMLAYKMTRDGRYLGEAIHALEALYRNDLSELRSIEHFEISYGSAAAIWVGRETEDQTYYKMARDLRNVILRVFYWYDDQTEIQTRWRSILGMVRGNGEWRNAAPWPNMAIWPGLTLYLKEFDKEKFLFQLANMQRITNFYFYEPCIPPEYQAYPGSPCPYIPYEGLNVLEDDRITGWYGKAVYMSNTTFWMYLLFEAFGIAQDKDIMVMNLDLFDDPVSMLAGKNRNYVVYNPKRTEESVQLSLKYFPDAEYTGNILNKLNGQKSSFTFLGKEHIMKIPMEPNSIVRIEVKKT